jgi:hypothetical protein
MRSLGSLFVAAIPATAGFLLAGWIGRTLLPSATRDLLPSLFVLFFSFLAAWLIAPPIYEKLAGRPARRAHRPSA